MRQFVVLVVLLLVSVFAGTAHAAEPTIVGATATPATAAPGQPVRLTATLSEPAPAGGLELNLRIFGDWYPTPRIRVLVPAGERTVSYDWAPPVGFRPFRDYLLQASYGGVTARADFRVNGLTDAGGYAVTAFDAPPTMVAGRSYRGVATINRAAPPGGLLLDRQQYGAYRAGDHPAEERAGGGRESQGRVRDERADAGSDRRRRDPHRHRPRLLVPARRWPQLPEGGRQAVRRPEVVLDHLPRRDRGRRRHDVRPRARREREPERDVRVTDERQPRGRRARAGVCAARVLRRRLPGLGDVEPGLARPRASPRAGGGCSRPATSSSPARPCRSRRRPPPRRRSRTGRRPARP